MLNLSICRLLTALSITTVTLALFQVPAADAAPSAQQSAANQLARGFRAPSKSASLSQLNRLRVANPTSMKGYSRTLYPHWKDASTWGWPVAPNNRCNVRNAALYRDGSGVRINTYCTVQSGRWLDPYTARTLTNKTSVDIDHLVPLAASWRSGAAAWTPTRRTAFANDPLVLVSVYDVANRAKGDKTPDVWKPANKAAHCLYAKRYVAVKSKYALTVSASEKAALTSMIRTCGA